MLLFWLYEVELELLADRHVNIVTIGEKKSPGVTRGNINTTLIVAPIFIKYDFFKSPRNIHYRCT